ncbi:ATP-binding protein [Sphingomonas sp. IC-56]|uniref:ATP-binding protein n=1 Tax=Sphingomonas sp. IC-56 TaxID=2898529 RepID=UPI001E48B59B|nr:ATP-binding protein [Sphingomonas sp. IC-56]MCD2323137.1 ATP-binding protein [Sphingomonas sp. IC-56]
MSSDPLIRIADALERLAPVPQADADPHAHPAYVWRGGVLNVARAFRPLSLNMLRGVERQQHALRSTLERLSTGAASHDVLLWGARGTGKSALVKSLVAAIQADGRDLALVEVAGTSIDTLPALFARLEKVKRAFAVFLDDLGFENAGEARVLRSLLDGGAEARPGNCRLIVTSNRRHLMPRDLAEQASAINPRDAVDDSLALADRFGLSLGFHAMDQALYLEVVESYAAAHGLSVDRQEAVEWATRRGSRSGRVAWQYVVEVAGRSGKPLD